MTFHVIIEREAMTQLREAAHWYQERSQSREVADKW